MKLVTYKTPQGPRLGAINNSSTQIVDLNAASQKQLPPDMLSFLNKGHQAMLQAKSILNADNLEAFTIPLDSATLLAPIQNPQKIIAIGRNYLAHALEQKVKPLTKPMIFAKYPSAIIGPKQSITWFNDVTQQVDFEAELAVIISKTAKRVPESKALDYVAGYTICNDVSARDLQFSDKQYTRGKSLDTFCPLGPWLVTADEIPDPQTLTIRAILNGEVMQNSNTSNMMFNVAHLISFSSYAFTLYPGDVITTGTPGGVGVFRDPPIFMQDGDIIIIEVEKIGQLSNPCKILRIEN